MNTHPITCLADLPELDSNDRAPNSRITLFRVGRFRHPTHGAWDITKDIFEKFIANFRTRGRVPIDFDHAPEAGGSTVAAGWITGLEVVGDELKANVEWTDLGAEAIRKKRYLFISPTWNLAGKDETGGKVGPKLIGAGLTNRPFFPWPALSLADDATTARAFRSVDDVPVQRVDGGDDGCGCAFCRTDHAARADDDRFESHFATATERGIKPIHRELYRHSWTRNSHLFGADDELKIVEGGLAQQRAYWDPSRDRQRRRGGAIGTAEESTAVSFCAPPGLEDDGRRLHEQVVAFASEHGLGDYLAAFRALTASPGDLPPQQVELPIDISDEEAAAARQLERRARALAAREDIDHVDAGGILELDDRIAEAEDQTGYHPTAWLDTSNDARPSPWRQDDFERDRRRAATIEMDLTRDVWQAAAEEGRDIVYDEAVKLRSDRIAELRRARDGELVAAQERESRRRKQAIDDELLRRARARVEGS